MSSGTNSKRKPLRIRIYDHRPARVPENLTEFRCPKCGRVCIEGIEPVTFLKKCKCGAWVMVDQTPAPHVSSAGKAEKVNR